MGCERRSRRAQSHTPRRECARTIVVYGVGCAYNGPVFCAANLQRSALPAAGILIVDPRSIRVLEVACLDPVNSL